MKKVLTYFTIVSLIAIFSCKKDETKVVVNDNNKTAASITSPSTGTTSVITENNMSTGNITFHWSKANYNINTPVTYYLQLDSVGKQFKKPISLGSVMNGDSINISYTDLNKLLISNGFKGNVQASVEVRVVSSLTNINNTLQFMDTISSHAIGMKITPLFVAVFPPKIWVVGDFQGWSNSDAAPTLTVIDSMKGTYEGYVNITSNKGFKFTSDHSWDNAHTYGDDGTNPGTSDGGKLSQVSGGGNITLKDGIGYIKLNVDLKGLTYTTVATTWAIIGNATAGGWSTDTPMTFDAVNKVWTVTTNLTQQSPPNDGWKFRANGAWDINYGSNNADGTLNLNGTNIGAAASGNYTITLNLNKIPYTFKLVKN